MFSNQNMHYKLLKRRVLGLGIQEHDRFRIRESSKEQVLPTNKAIDITRQHFDPALLVPASEQASLTPEFA